MCGIVGFTGKRPAAPILLDGLSKLEYRGYDSAGLAVRDGEALAEVVKAKGRLTNLVEKTDAGKALNPLVKLCTQILSDDPLFFLINSYTTGLQPAVLAYMLGTVMKKYDGIVTADEIGLPVSSNGLVLPCGASGRWESK